MNTIKLAFAALVTAFVAIIGAFSLGQFRGRRGAEADAQQQRSEELSAAVSAVAQRRIDAIQGASDVQQSLDRLSDNDIDNELREKWHRPGGG